MITDPIPERPASHWLRVGPRLLAAAEALSAAWENAAPETAWSALDGKLADIVRQTREAIVEAKRIGS